MVGRNWKVVTFNHRTSYQNSFTPYRQQSFRSPMNLVYGFRNRKLDTRTQFHAEHRSRWFEASAAKIENRTFCTGGNREISGRRRISRGTRTFGQCGLNITAVSGGDFATGMIIIANERFSRNCLPTIFSSSSLIKWRLLFRRRVTLGE